MTKRIRTSMSLDKEVIDFMDEFSSLFNISRSELVNSVFIEAMPQLAIVLEEFKKFSEKVSLNTPVTEEQLDMFSGRIFRKLFTK